MKEYEVVFTYLNGCAGEAFPTTTIEEMEIQSPESFLKEKFGKDFPGFTCEILSPTQSRWKFDNGTLVYIYEFNEI